MDYARAIVEHFVRLRGKGAAVSAADEALLLSWESMEIPLDVVLEGVDSAFDRKREPPKSLSECGRWVRAGYKKWSSVDIVDDRDAPSGCSTTDPRSGLPRETQDRLARWRESQHAPLAAAAAQVWAELVAESAAVGVIPEEMVAIVGDAVRMVAVERGAPEDEIDDWMV